MWPERVNKTESKTASRCKKFIRISPKCKKKHSRSKEAPAATPDGEMEKEEQAIARGHIPNGFSDQEKTELKQAFDLFDKNHDGKISCDELACVLRTLGHNYSREDVEEMIKNADTNENGAVEYDEFLTMMNRWSVKGESKEPTSNSETEKRMEAFRVFDMDGNGFIDQHELRYVMRRLGENLSDDDIMAMFKEADLNGDGLIDFSEFSRLMRQMEGPNAT